MTLRALETLWQANMTDVMAESIDGQQETAEEIMKGSQYQYQL